MITDSPLITCTITQTDIDRFNFPQDLLDKTISRKVVFWSNHTGENRKKITARKIAEAKYIAEGRDPQSTRAIVGLDKFKQRPRIREAEKKTPKPAVLTYEQKLANSWLSRAMQ